MIFWIIIWLIVFNLFNLIIFGAFEKYKKVIQYITFIISLFIFFLSLTFLILFDNLNGSYQFLWVGTTGLQNIAPLYLHTYSFGIDGISLFFILLITFLIPLCLLTLWKHSLQFKIDYCFYFVLLELFLILSFASLDMITFFIFFESILIPMFLPCPE